jgi:hypothetical protein
MNRLVRFGVVIVGYIAACLVASVAEHVRVLHTQGPDAQASSGMYAFGDFLLFITVFGVLALFPTGLALYFLRPFEKFWAVLSFGLLAIAVTGLCTAPTMGLGFTQPTHSALVALAGIGLLSVLTAPLLALAFAIATVLAPAGRWRWILLAATVIEGVLGIFGILSFFMRRL